MPEGCCGICFDLGHVTIEHSRTIFVTVLSLVVILGITATIINLYFKNYIVALITLSISVGYGVLLITRYSKIPIKR